MEVLIGVLVLALLFVCAYALCYSAGEADRTLEQGFREAFVDKKK
jgi:hypothetical protein